MPQQLALSRAAKLIGISRTALQKRIKDGGLHSFDGTISTEELLQLYPDLRLEDSGRGFDYARLGQLFDAMPDLNQHHGRGILLVKSLCRELTYSGPGNVVSARYLL